MRAWRLCRLILLLLAGMPAALASLQATATMPGRLPSLLHVLERDIGGMLEQSELLRGRLDVAFDVEGAGGRLAGIYDGDYRSNWRALRQTMMRIERNLGGLRSALRESDDGRAGDILLSMRVELSTMSLALIELAEAEGAAARQEALGRMDMALHSLDGAVAAIWALGPKNAGEFAAGVASTAVVGSTGEAGASGAGNPLHDHRAGFDPPIPERESAPDHD